MVQSTGLGTSSNALVFRAPFSYPPDTPISPVLTVRTQSWNAREDILRRFSDPASEAVKDRTDKSIKSAVEAYNDAVAKLRHTLKKDEVDGILSSTSSTVTQLHKVALDIQQEQTNTLDRRKVGKFIDVLDHYSGVFDVLSQCDFSYMTLIWGVLKFGLIASKNHHNFLLKFTDMMVDIGLNLSRIELYRHIFPTGRMLELVSELYSAVLEFLQEVVVYCQKKSFRKYWASFSKPFDIQFGRLIERIRRLQTCIEDDARAGALVMQMVQHRSITRHQVDLQLRRSHYESTLRDIHESQVTPLFLEIKRTLFHGFEIEASYHEELATTFKLTSSPAWAHWLSIEQQYVPSRFIHETTVIQAECDAPDAATCLQWVAQARSEYSHIVSSYLLWARGMTAQSAVGSIVFQMLQQRPQVLSSAGLTMKSFQAANSSLPKLWSLFLHLVRSLGGLRVYISIGSVGQEEYGIVQRFVDLCQKWDGPPINVILIHPFDENFEKVEDCVDIDEKYDVHPSLTTTDALHHVVLLELEVHDQLSETVQGVLWESLWREVRYAVIGIALTQAISEIQQAAEDFARQKVCSQDVASLWASSVSKWTKNRRVVNILREQIQRHLNLIDIHLPDDVRILLEEKLKAAVDTELSPREKRALSRSLRNGSSRPLEDEPRNEAWERIQDAIRPGTYSMYSRSIRELMGDVINAYLEEPPENEREARSFAHDLLKKRFGWNGRWKASFLDNKELIIDGIVIAIDHGFSNVVSALNDYDTSEPCTPDISVDPLASVQ